MAGQSLEDEMSRFEQEIAGAAAMAPPIVASSNASFVIGASTFNAVQQQLSALRAQVYRAGAPGAEVGLPSQQTTNLPAMPQPMGPQNGMFTSTLPPVVPMMPASNQPVMQGTGFIPHQLRSRVVGVSVGSTTVANMPISSVPSSDSFTTSSQPSSQAAATKPVLSSAPVRYDQPQNPSSSNDPPKIVYSAKPVLNKYLKADTKKSDLTGKDTANKQSDKKREAPINDTPSLSVPAPALPEKPIAPTAIESQPVAKKVKKQKEKKFVRCAANEVWEDNSLSEWDPNDFRIFCGDLGNEVTDEKLAEAFKQYPSLQKAKVIRDKRTHKTKGYGFISFHDPTDYTRAMREMNGKYVGNRPIKLRKSNWRDRNVEQVKKKEKEKKRLGFR